MNSGPEPVEGSNVEPSKIENGWGFLLSLFAFVLVWGCGRGAAAEESPADRVSIDDRPS